MKPLKLILIEIHEFPPFYRKKIISWYEYPFNHKKENSTLSILNKTFSDFLEEMSFLKFSKRIGK